MTEDEFKITIRAFFPTLGFTLYDGNGETPVVVSDYLQHDLLGLCKFKFVRGMAYLNDLPCPVNTEKYPNLFIETIKGLKQNGWSPLFNRFMEGNV